MKKQINTPKLRFPEFDDVWVENMLGKISDNIMYGMNSAAIEFDGHNKYLRITDIDESSRTFTPNPLTSPNGIIEDKYKLKVNDIVFARTGASVGKSYLYNKNDGNLFFAGFLIRFSITKGNSYFVYTQTLRDSYSRWVQLMSMRSGQPGINAEEYKIFSFKSPTIPEQTKIANFLTAVDDKLTLLKKKKKLLEQYKKGVMQKLLSQELRFKDENGEDFTEWKEKKLGEVLYEHLHKNSNNEFPEVFSVAKHKGVINQIEHLGRSFSAKETLHYKVCYPNDVVYTKSPTSDFPFGIIKQNHTNRTGIVSPLYGVFTPKTPALGFILHNYFDSWKNVYNYLNPLVQKGAKNTMNINNKDFLNGAEIYLPTSEVEQIKIANFLSAIDDKINHCGVQIEKREGWKKGLLQQMFC